MNAGQLSMGLSVAGMVSGAIGGFYSAKSTKSSLKFQAAMSEINARIAEQGAQQELFKGQQEVGKLTLAAGHLKSRQRASMAANGIDLGEGSAAEIQASTDIMTEIDANTLTANAVRSAWGYKMQGVNQKNEALMKRGTASAISPFAAGASSLLGSAGQVAGQWYSLNKERAFDA